MSRDPFEQIYELFAELSPLAPEERARILSERKLSAEVREEVEALLGEVGQGRSADPDGHDTVASAIPPYPSQPQSPSEFKLPEALQDFGTYRLLKELGRGAQGVVFLAEDKRLNRRVALKMLSAAATQSDSIRERFHREAEITSKLNHAGICSIYEVGEVEGVPFIAMQFIQGLPLEKALVAAKDAQKAGTPADIPSIGLGGKSWPEIQKLLAFFERAARALHVAHEAGLVHRDIKPGNIMVTSGGDPILVDFGAARDLDDIGHTLTQDGQLVGTPAYMAPEQIRGDRAGVDRRADIYGLTATLYECVTLARVFDADSLDELFTKIQTKSPIKARRLNDTVTRDLEVVLEVGMEREIARRYPTAEALADDLRRVAQQQQVRARAAGLVRRLRKWARANPTRAVATAAALLFACSAIGYWIYQMRERTLAVRGHVRDAERHLDAGNFPAAFESIAKALERDPENPTPKELRSRAELAQDRAQREARKNADLLAATRARGEAAVKLGDWQRASAALSTLRATLDAERKIASAGYADEPARGRFAAQENKATDLEFEVETLLDATREALERSVRLEAPWIEGVEGVEGVEGAKDARSAESDAALADFYLQQWRHALASNQTAVAAAMRNKVVAHDPHLQHERELLGRGLLSITVEPMDAELHLFRYESRETVRPYAPVPCAVPVPTSGVGRIRPDAWCEDFYPGDPCLLILAVEPGSIAAERGLVPGDLVLRLQGFPCGDGIFARPKVENGTESPAPAGWRRIQSLNGIAIQDAFDVRSSETRREKPAMAGDPVLDRVLFASESEELTVNRATFELAAPPGIVRRAATEELHLLCLRDGERLAIVVPPGRTAGLAAEPTAYPLISSAENLVARASPIVAEPGSYLIVARRAGFETLRYSCVVPRLGETIANLQLLPEGATPPGFVYVPPGPFEYGGDGEARNSPAKQVLDEPGFWIARREVTNAEWFEFVNDPEILARIRATKDWYLYLPRESGKLRVQEQPSDGTFRQARGLDETAVYLISYRDAEAYVAWLNARAERLHEPWRYDLPTATQWEKAARGADGRPFPWGRRFDPSLTIGRFRKGDFLLDEPAGIETRDESPYGVRDLGGSRFEWTSEKARDSGREVELEFFMRGGSWFVDPPSLFRSAARFSGNANATSGSTGLRIVALRRT